MTDHAFEDIVPGTAFDLGTARVDRDAIVAFAREYDFQPFHVDEAQASASPVGGLIASGWHSCALGMRLLYDGFLCRAASMGSPGIAEVRWVRPVRPGDVLSGHLDVREARPSRSRPDRGLVGLHLALSDPSGAPLMTQDFTVMFARRAAVAPLQPGGHVAFAERLAIAPPKPAPGPPRPYLEDLVPGTVETFEPRTFTREGIVGFARAFDPQPFHIDEVAACASHFGGLCASGWQTAATWMRQMLLHRGASADGARIGPSPGFKDLRWLKPVYAGDTITYDSTLTQARPSASRPGWGLVLAHNTGRNQRGETVISFESAVLWERRPT